MTKPSSNSADSSERITVEQAREEPSPMTQKRYHELMSMIAHVAGLSFEAAEKECFAEVDALIASVRQEEAQAIAQTVAAARAELLCVKHARHWDNHGVCPLCLSEEQAEQITFLQAEIAQAMKVLQPNMPESGLVDACRQIKQVAISEADNSSKMEARLHALEQQGISQEWQTIETAPKDGSSLLLYLVSGGMCIGQWTTFESPFLRRTIAEWQDNSEGFTLEPTHWMPLPLPPEADQ